MGGILLGATAACGCIRPPIHCVVARVTARDGHQHPPKDRLRERRIARLAKLMECDVAALKPWLEQMAAKRDVAEKDLERMEQEIE